MRSAGLHPQNTPPEYTFRLIRRARSEGTFLCDGTIETPAHCRQPAVGYGEPACVGSRALPVEYDLQSFQRQLRIEVLDVCALRDQRSRGTSGGVTR